MKSNKELIQLLMALSKLYKLYRVEDITVDNFEIEFRSDLNPKLDRIGKFLYALVIFLPPIFLLIYEKGKWIEVIAICWIGIFTYDLIKMIRYENNVKIQIPNHIVSIERVDPLSRVFFRKKKIEFNQIKEFEIKHFSISKFGRGYSGIILITNDRVRHRLISFEDHFVARKTKNILLRIIQIQNKTQILNKD